MADRPEWAASAPAGLPTLRVGTAGTLKGPFDIPRDGRRRCFDLGLVGKVDRIRPIASSRTSQLSDSFRQVEWVELAGQECAGAVRRS
jgi:hypothetical protein